MTDGPPWSDRTFGNDDRLPRVPLPTLDDSCARFVSWCAPLLTAEQLAATEAAAREFAAPDGPGRVLHAALAGYDAEETTRSWLDIFWPYRYLGRRDRIALNANFFFLFGDPPAGRPSQVDRAASLIHAAAGYKRRLDDEAVPPVMSRGRPLSMDQNKFLFSTTRIPGRQQDTVRVPYSDDYPGPSTARHIIVFSRANAFRLDVLDETGALYPHPALAAGLRAVLAASPSRPSAPVGHLTTLARADWARARDVLQGDPGHAAALDDIESALFCVNLDDLTPSGVQQACDELLAGDSGNRWFDKSVSFIVFADGTAGINIEHCGLDGTTVLSFTDAVLAEANQPPPAAADTPAPEPQPVAFTLDEPLAATVTAAGDDFAAYAASMATTIVSFPGFGAEDIKALKMSPDAFVQLAYQLAHQRAKNMLGATYESISTRHFRRGRTEAMRVVTPEMVSFAAAMDDPLTDDETRRARAEAAAARHVERAKECQSGQVPEQHLWELLLIARRRGAELGITEEPALYSSPGWTIMRSDYLSTSSAPSENIQFFGFGSTSPTCIGVAYVLLPGRFNVYLSTPQPVADAMRSFASHLHDTVAELRDLLARR